MTQKLLLVDDEPTQLVLLKGQLAREGYDVVTSDGGREAADLLAGKAGEGFSAVLLDLNMPEMDGIAVLESVRPRRPRLPIIILTAHSSVSNVVGAMRAGASDFISKPASAERLRTAVANAIAQEPLVGEVLGVAEKMKAPADGFGALIGKSPVVQQAVNVAKKAASVSVPVLIEGESGVGKEVFARAIHCESDRRKKPFVAVNCGAIPDKLVESILFGHEKGAFTGATDKHIGKFQEASGGTLFLDEVGELPLDVQVKLLRVLQEGEVDPIGARAPVKVDIRLISATNRDVAQMVADGSFREDLYYRLNVFPLRLPPLRARTGDVPLLAENFIERAVKSENLPAKRLSPAAAALLDQHHWPGNIRQLQNAIFRAVILADSDVIQPHDFGQIQAQAAPTVPSASPTSHAASQAPSALPSTADMLDELSIPILDEQGHIRPMSELENEIIRHALSRYQGKMSEIARRLGIGRSTLYRKIQEIGEDNYPA